MLTRGRGCLPDPDYAHPPNRHPYAVVVGASGVPPEASDGVRPWCPPVSDQGPEESCVAYATANALYARQWIEGDLPEMPSRRALWYWARAMRGAVSENVGTSPTDLFVALAMHGYPTERVWGLERRFNERPDQETMLLAADQREVQCARLSDAGEELAHDLRVALHQRLPVTISLLIDAAYGRTTSATWTRDHVNEGWHRVMASHYDRDGVWTLGSYGPGHGARGYVMVPWADIVSRERCRDGWAVRFAPAFVPQEAA